LHYIHADNEFIKRLWADCHSRQLKHPLRQYEAQFNILYILTLQFSIEKTRGCSNEENSAYSHQQSVGRFYAEGSQSRGGIPKFMGLASAKSAEKDFKVTKTNYKRNTAGKAGDRSE